MTYKILIAIPMLLVIFVSLIGNIMVCVAIKTDRKLRKIENLFYVSLAVADLLVAGFVMTLAAINDLGFWCFEQKLCDLWFALDVMCSTSSILNLCAISLDRYFHVRDPLQYERLVSKNVIISAIIVIWILSSTISFLPISLGWHMAGAGAGAGAGGSSSNNTSGNSIDNFQETNRTPKFCAINLSTSFAALSSCVSFYVPCLIMFGIYAKLYMYARKHVRNIQAMTLARLDTTNDETESNVSLHRNSSPGRVSDHKAAVTIGVIMGVFLICWFPFFIINVISPICKNCVSETTFKTLTWFGYLNSAFNPIIYSIFNKEFREAFKRILLNHWNAVHRHKLFGNRRTEKNILRRFDKTNQTDDNNFFELTNSHDCRQMPTEMKLEIIVQQTNDEIDAI